jgi:hypothetical protein
MNYIFYLIRARYVLIISGTLQTIKSTSPIICMISFSTSMISAKKEILGMGNNIKTTPTINP